MANTILVGFIRSVGDFTDKKTGEIIKYSNRTLHLISDDGSDDDNIGFSPFDVEKIKLKQLSSILLCREDDTAVDNALKALINKHVNLRWAPRNGELVLVGLSEVKRS